MKLNNKGFAISGVLYPIFILFLVFILGILGILGTNKINLDRIKKEIEMELNGAVLDPYFVYEGIELDIQLGYNFNLLDGLEAYDYTDKKIDNNYIKYTSTPAFDYNTPGTYIVNYTVSDSKGRTNNLVRSYNVKAMNSNNYAYTGAVQTFTAEKGKYKFELWGAQGYNSTYGGKGAYTVGTLDLELGDKFDVFVGQQGQSVASRALLAYNGGGGGSATCGTNNLQGGGATDIRISDTTKYRYVKDYLNGNSINTGNHWVEIEVYDKIGNNVALTKPVTSSIAQDPTRPNAWVTDGNKDTNNWTNHGSSLQWVEIDLGAEYEIDYVKIWHYFGDSRTYYETRTVLSNAAKTITKTINDYNFTGTYAENATGKTSSLADWNNFDYMKARLMVAAGGGATAWGSKYGGAGGTLSGNNGDHYANAAALGLAATTTAGGSLSGKFGVGGTAALDSACNCSESGGGGGGYYGGGGARVSGFQYGGTGAGGSSFISGYSGVDAISSTSTPIAISHTGSPNHYSGLVFNNSQIIGGTTSMPDPITGTQTGNDGHGYAKITPLIVIKN